MITVYFDGACKYCSKEINYYKTISSTEEFKWIDVAENPDAMIDYNITQAEALLFLHAVDNKKNVYIGVEAFALIWKNLRHWKLLGHLVSLPLIKLALRHIYEIFAKRRFKHYQHCRLASKQLSINKTTPNQTNL